MSLAISVEHVSKVYRLGSIGGAMLSEDVTRWWARMRGRPDPSLQVGVGHHGRRSGDEFWALEDVTFAAYEGEALGIIGRNGAGKSTLLKILSQVTAPSFGQIKLRGRIASLLEVGTGFHPDLTGRENIFLNGAILGMTKAEIRARFDEIVAFSECEEFIDTPVKRYSSGMYVRLAFAVAAHLEPEILIVDEVLAVGDAQFQKKCLGKMGEVSRRGRTVLFVSHSMAAIKRLCSRAVVLNGGKVVLVDQAGAAVDEYLARQGASQGSWQRDDAAPGNAEIYLSEIRIVNSSGRATADLSSTDSPEIMITLTCPRQTRPMQVVIRLTNHEGIPVFSSANTDESGALVTLGAGRHTYSVELPPGFLAAGRYNLMATAHIPRVQILDSVDVVTFNIENTGMAIQDDRQGVVTPMLHWEHEELGSLVAGR